MKIDLDPSKMEQIDIIAAANVIYNRTRDLSERVNTEILKPISAWIDDPDFMKKHRVMIDAEAPNWAEYKRKQRQWTDQQKQIAIERLRLYWQAIRRKRKMRQAIAGLIPRAGPRTTMTFELNAGACNALAEIVAPFSPPEVLKAETQAKFQKARARPVLSILPWGTILAATIRTNQTFDKIPQYHPSTKKDKVAKLMTLLQMETDQALSLVQQEPFGEIEIENNQLCSENQATLGIVIIKDRSGATCELKWLQLSYGQRKKVVADLINYEIICIT
jgi:hypothetical protein